ncbi:MAG: zinc carboxypeptidase, partial [Planctomycetota bacterium]|nr:zinc carboxypeptidase [Planctomycetota bacterium]
WCQNEPVDAYYGGLSAGSETETQLILELIRQHGPRRILMIHCIDDVRHCVNYDGPAEELARAMAKENGYEVRSDIGHATPGSLGTWAGYERQIPTVTLELPANETDEKCWQDNRDAVMSFIQAAIE